MESNELTKQQSRHWTQLMTDHRGWLGAVIFARVRDRDAVEEVLQETALAAVAGTHCVDSEKMSRWLYRVAIRQSILYRRKQCRNTKKTEGYKAQTLVNQTTVGRDADTPYEILAAHEQAELVSRAVCRLTNSDREVLLLKYTENWSCQEIATRLGVSLTAIKSRLLRARGNLRRELTRLSETWDLK